MGGSGGAPKLQLYCPFQGILPDPTPPRRGGDRGRKLPYILFLFKYLAVFPFDLVYCPFTGYPILCLRPLVVFAVICFIICCFTYLFNNDAIGLTFNLYFVYIDTFNSAGYSIFYLLYAGLSPLS
jgi:hypothetical protein